MASDKLTAFIRLHCPCGHTEQDGIPDRAYERMSEHHLEVHGGS